MVLVIKQWWTIWVWNPNAATINGSKLGIYTIPELMFRPWVEDPGWKSIINFYWASSSKENISYQRFINLFRIWSRLKGKKCVTGCACNVCSWKGLQSRCVIYFQVSNAPIKCVKKCKKDAILIMMVHGCGFEVPSNEA